MAELKIIQVRSANGASPIQRDTLRSLNLGRIGSETTRPDSDNLQGMIRTVTHLITVEEAS